MIERLDDDSGLPDPGSVHTLDALVERLRMLKVYAGDPSYESIKDRVNVGWAKTGRPDGELTGRSTVADCFRLGRRRMNTDLMIAVVRALHPEAGYVAQWRQALQLVGAENAAAAQVRVQGSLPPDPAGFTGRTAELRRLRGAAAVISGMAGVGKTQLAVHAGHLLDRERPFDRVLLVDLRGFHPDPAQPSADPAAVLEGFLRLLGVAGPEIPHDRDARARLYRALLAGTRTLVVLDNAADAEQVRPLLPRTPGCPVLVTSRRDLTGLDSATHVVLDVFTAGEARRFLTRAASQAPVDPDSAATARIARRCGYLPLALGLVAGHLRTKSGWTLTDHADWLDERHRDRRLDTGVELALDLSYHHLPADRQRMLRLLALHPSHDFDAYAAAALAGEDLGAARDHLFHLHGDHLLQQSHPGRYTFHDLVRLYAATQAQDQDRGPVRRAALTRLFDHYLAAAATAMDTLHPAEAELRPRIPPAGTPVPDLADPDAAREWLDTERHTLVAVAVHTAAHGWPTHTTRLARTLFRYLTDNHLTDAVTVNTQALQAARHSGDPLGQAHALTELSVARWRLGELESAAEELLQALPLFRQGGDQAGQARALNNLGIVETRLGRYQPATDHYTEALTLFQQAGHLIGESNVLNNLGTVETRVGQYESATDHYLQALALCRRTGDQIAEARALNNLGIVEGARGRYDPAGEHLQRALDLCRQLGNRTGEANVLDSLGLLHVRLGRPAEAAAYHQQGLTICRETGYRDGEASALNGLGEAARAAGLLTEALAHHTAAHALAAEIGGREQQARADAGLGHTHDLLGEPGSARQHYQDALTLYIDLGMPEAEEIRARL